MIDDIDIKARFMRLSVRLETLEPFGFNRKDGIWEYSEPIVDGAFSCVVTIKPKFQEPIFT